MTADLVIDFPACLAADFPEELPAAERAVTRVLSAIDAGTSFTPLEERSPGLRGNDWSNYLRCSEARMVHAANLLKRKGALGDRMLDYGAYFGNFSLMFRELGLEVDAVDDYRGYQPSLASNLELLRRAGVRPLDFAETGRDLARVDVRTYDVVICMGVIEHVPHTPRVLLEPLDRVLKSGGVLLMDTPNLAQLFNRQKLARGEAVMTPLAIQYHATVPFEGHHREYTLDEMIWMVQELGHEVLAAETFNYSTYGHKTLKARDVTNHWRTVANPTMRELILIASRKPEVGRPVRRTDDWHTVFEDPEQYWVDRLPEGFEAEDGSALVATELLVTELQEGVALRDGEIAKRDQVMVELQALGIQEVAIRDAEIANLNERISAVQRRLDRTPSERVKRAWRRLTSQP